MPQCCVLGTHVKEDKAFCRAVFGGPSRAVFEVSLLFFEVSSFPGKCRCLSATVGGDDGAAVLVCLFSVSMKQLSLNSEHSYP